MADSNLKQFVPIVIIDAGYDGGMSVGINRRLPLEVTETKAWASAKSGFEAIDNAIGFTIKAI